MHRCTLTLLLTVFLLCVIAGTRKVPTAGTGGTDDKSTTIQRSVIKVRSRDYVEAAKPTRTPKPTRPPNSTATSTPTATSTATSTPSSTATAALTRVR